MILSGLATGASWLCYYRALQMGEASAYFHIGYKKMRTLVKDYKGAKWILINGNRIMIKREQFEKWLDNQSVI